MFTHFYHRSIYNMITIFGNLFNNITLVRYNADFTEEINRIKVPIIYGPKEKWIQRWIAEPDLKGPIESVLPRMSYEMLGMQIDPDRAKSNLQKETSRSSTDGSRKYIYKPAPYDLQFELTIVAKTIEDANQIVEQILPYFQPDFTVAYRPISGFDKERNLIISLLSATQDIQYDGDMETQRAITWTLSFVMKGEVAGPVIDSKLIRHVIVKIYDNILEDKYIRITVNNGEGYYTIGDTVYQGQRSDHAFATGEVQSFNANTGILQLKNTQGTFLTNHNVVAFSTNASWNLASFQMVPPVMQRIEIRPNPIDADPGDPYGYLTTVTEFPNAEEN